MYASMEDGQNQINWTRMMAYIYGLTDIESSNGCHFCYLNHESQVLDGIGGKMLSRPSDFLYFVSNFCACALDSG